MSPQLYDTPLHCLVSITIYSKMASVQSDRPQPEMASEQNNLSQPDFTVAPDGLSAAAAEQLKLYKNLIPVQQNLQFG